MGRGWAVLDRIVIPYVMSTVEHQSPVVPAPIVVISPLRHGDRLSRDEFERRYAAMPHVKKAEPIEEIVFMPSPARFEHDGEPQEKRIFAGIKKKPQEVVFFWGFLLNFFDVTGSVYRFRKNNASLFYK